jgi:hypothetical protein
MPRKRFTNEQIAVAPPQAENGKLKRPVADLTVDRAMLQDVLKRQWRGLAVRREVAGHPLSDPGRTSRNHPSRS